MYIFSKLIKFIIIIIIKIITIAKFSNLIGCQMLHHVVTNYVVHKLIARSGHLEHLQELLLTSIFSKTWKTNFKALTRTSKNLSVEI